jgi:ABC-type Na+ efflux pump permease subunit
MLNDRTIQIIIWLLKVGATIAICFLIYHMAYKAGQNSIINKIAEENAKNDKKIADIATKYNYVLGSELQQTGSNKGRYSFEDVSIRFDGPSTKKVKRT